MGGEQTQVMERSTNTGVDRVIALSVKLIHIGFLLLDLAQVVTAKLSLSSRGHRGVIQDTEVGVIYRTSKSKKIPNGLVVGDALVLSDDLVVRDVYIR